MSEEEFKAKFIEMMGEFKGELKVTNKEVSGLKEIVELTNEKQDERIKDTEEDVKTINSKMAKVGWSVVVGLIAIVGYFLKSGGTI